jgi:hypothetical protein
VKKTMVLGLFVLVLFFAVHSVRADFYVIPVGGAGTAINSLPYTITSPGFYYHKKNFMVEGTGITVNADDITIDLMGFCITGPGDSSESYGVSIKPGKANIEIRNGTVRGFGRQGISASNTGTPSTIVKGVRVLNIRSYQCRKRHSGSQRRRHGH